MREKRSLFGAFIASALVCILTACGEAEPEETLEERAAARWQLMIDRDFGAAWEYYTPGFRETTPREEFANDMSRRPIRWTGAKVIGTECDDLVCRVDVEIEYRAVGAPSGQGRMQLKRRIDDEWVFLDGQWWYSSN